MAPGSFAGFAIGMAACGIFTIVAMKVSKKDGEKLKEILERLSEQEKNEIKNQTYTETDGKDMYITNAYVVSTVDEGDKVKAVIMFYSPEHQEFYTRNIKLSKSDATSKGITAGAFVPAKMKYDKEMHYYDFKKLL